MIRALEDVLPGLESVYDHGLIGASDPEIFAWASEFGFAAIVSADLDFVHLAERIEPRPKVIRIERCDFPSNLIAFLIRRELIPVFNFLASQRATLSIRL